VLFALIGFVIGWVAAPGGDTHTDVVLRPGSSLAPGGAGGFFNGNGNGNGNNGGGATTPSTPRAPRIPRRGSAFLGVATSPSTDPAGARVVEVVPGSPAADGGLKADDVITTVDGRKVANPRQLATRIAAHQPNANASITYVRNGATSTTSVTLTRRPGLAPTTPTTNSGS
jgi:membrane-associated protease RseP (regulator of RpoE activity)